MWRNLKNKINKLFNKDNSPEEDSNEELVFLNNKIPDDEVFARNFNASGGHFLYCENRSDALSSLKQIVEHERITSAICLDENLQAMLQNLGVKVINLPSKNEKFSFLNCEYLVAFDGGVMLSSDQTSGRGLNNFPDNFIIYATTKQLVKNVSEALEKIRRNKTGNLPTNITSIRGENIHDFGTSSNAKNIYLLLVENNT